MIKIRRNLHLSALCRLAILLPFIPMLQGSGQSRIHIHETPAPEQVTTATGAVGLSLRTAFTLLDAEDQVLQSFEIENASFEVEGNSYSALIEELETPWSLVMLVDASKTFASLSGQAAFKDVRNALGSAAGQLPDSATLAIMAFDDAAPTLLSFTQSDEQIGAAIRGLRPKTFGKSCMYNAIYEAVNKLAGAPGRRAVIVFTASADDCATRTAQEVINLAEQNRVQIYAVGLLGYTITQADLDALADPSGGISELKDEETLGFGLSNIMAVLSNQWTAKATIYPSAGQQTAVLTVNLKDETSLVSPPIPFLSSQDYIPPTEIHLQGTIQSVGTGILFNLDIIQPEQIRQLNVSIISKDTGQAVMAQSMVQFSDVNTVPAAGLVSGAEYTLIVNAIDESGQILAEASADFTYEPPQPRLLVSEIQTPTLDEPGFLITVEALNLEGAVKFTAWLVDVQTSLPISGTEITVPVGEPILIPSEDLDSGAYAVVVQALDVGDKVLAETSPAKTAYERPGALEGFRRWIGESPLAIAGITGLFCLTLGGIVALVWVVAISPRRRSKPATVELVMPQKARRAAPSAERPTPPEGTPRPAVPERKEPPAREARPMPAPSARPQPAALAEGIAPRQEKVRMPSARLSLIKPDSPKFSVKIERSPFTVGRRKGNDGAIPLDSSSGVSGNHFIIRFSEGEFHLQDEKSTFGTTINGKTVLKGRLARLEDGAIIGLGPEVRLKFEIDDKAKNE